MNTSLEYMNIDIRKNFSFKRKSKSNCKNEIHDIQHASDVFSIMFTVMCNL